MDDQRASSGEGDHPDERSVGGKDEMNLAEFPFAALRRVGDNRKAIIHESWTTDETGNRRQQRWVVTGDSLLGLPTEFDERVVVALLAITAQQDFAARKVRFSIYQILKVMGITRSQKAYQDVEQSLARLVRVTFESTNAFWDHTRRERITTSEAFHLLERYWLRTKESSNAVRDQEEAKAYIVWGEHFWTNFTANYLKHLDLGFFYSLSTPTARRLYRFLDKRMQYQSSYEIDIFELASRLGMVRYNKPVKVRQTLQSALDELIARGYLTSAEVVKHQSGGKTYTRMRFERAGAALPSPTVPANPDTPADEEAGDDLAARLVAQGVGLHQADDLVARFPAPRIEEKLALLEWKVTGGSRGRPVKDRAAWLVNAVLQDYQPPAGFHMWRATRAAIHQSALEGLLEEPLPPAGSAGEMGVASSRASSGRTAWEVWVIEHTQVSEPLERLTRQLQDELQLQMTRATFDQWARQLLIVRQEEGQTDIAVPTRSAYEWLSNRLQRTFELALTRVTGASTVHFVLLERPPD